MKQPDIKFMLDLKAELQRARQLHPDNQVLYTALGEEVGELAKALLEEEPERIYAEAVQVACVACRIATEGDATMVAWRRGKPVPHVLSEAEAVARIVSLKELELREITGRGLLACRNALESCGWALEKALKYLRGW